MFTIFDNIRKKIFNFNPSINFPKNIFIFFELYVAFYFNVVIIGIT